MTNKENKEWQKNIDNYSNEELIIILEDLNFLTADPIAEELIGYKYTQLIYEIIQTSDNDNFFESLKKIIQLL
ncbi:MAG: hypothetical protein EIB84_02320 [Spiroplasma poulsonii]|uniref:Uncharacterized protein n=1 Tax=Spiroplasma poulsonii TaxID=2138 RepID=A0A2P6FBX2_9MOLU|nr:hypothetical protein [Spiroplasma poulsonii]KAF0851372.1 hypothetical protein MSROBK_007950 [Spiroplasma poulsonii]MBW1241712.1 hypothetical protein [Spiroplasma poulsonii]PQM30965.1 hypothetical protein SMSRO_SF007590 [Spiroplasma poulsonii]PWF95959.1 hypothetical protein SMSE_13970 [Spiroplasma poulsonii]PWF98735.1 hypothetical protein SMH99_12980 [Spiroplasma poulsonii]